MQRLASLAVGAACVAGFWLPAAGQAPAPAPQVGAPVVLSSAPDSLAHGTFDAPFWVMLRSVAFPGWGQAKNGEWLKALLVAGLEAAFIERLVFERRMVHYNRDRITNEPELAGIWSVREKNHNNHRRDFIWWTSLYVLLSMGDAYVGAHLGDYDVSLQAEPEPIGDAEGGEAGGLSLRLFLSKTARRAGR